jgi:hypothetical protein
MVMKNWVLNGNESDGTISTTAFDLAETYPTDDSSLEAGDVVVVSDSTDEDRANYLVSKLMVQIR